MKSIVYRIKAFSLATVTGGCFLFFWLGSLILSWVILPLVRASMWRRPSIERTHRCQDVVGYGFRLFIGAMRTVRNLVFRPRTVTLDVPDGPFVMIANHPTLIDVTAILAVHPRMSCVAKTELFRSILAGRLLRYCGHIEGGGGGLMDGGEVIRRAVDRLNSSEPVLIFPEGTRSPVGGLRRFKPGAFEIAIRAGVPIVPVLLTCDPPTLQKGLPWWALPKRTAQFNMTQLATVPAEQLGDRAEAVATRFQELFRTELDARQARRSSEGDRAPDCSAVRWASGAGGNSA